MVNAYSFLFPSFLLRVLLWAMNIKPFIHSFFFKVVFSQLVPDTMLVVGVTAVKGSEGPLSVRRFEVISK